MSRVFMLFLVCVAALAVSSCSGRVKPVKENRFNCLGMADDLKTLKKGDELPRVLQVLGQPSRAYRITKVIGRNYDVLEYDTGGMPCAKAVLHTKKTLRVVFDSHGQYIGQEASSKIWYRRATTMSMDALVVDPVIYQP